jgi:cobalt/nickel transport system permease protein
VSSINLDPYRQGASLLHRADARLKLLLTIGFILTVALLPDGAWAVLLILLSLALSAGLIARVGLTRLLCRSLLALPFLLAALPVLFSLPGQPLFRFSLLGSELTLSQPGLERFLTIALKSWLSILAALIFTATTPVPRVLEAMRMLRVPRLLVAVIGLMARYLTVMVDAAGRLLRARDSRSAAPPRPGLRGGGRLAWRARVAGGMAGSLLLRSIERSERVYAAMLSRGYDGEVRSQPSRSLDAGAWLALISGLTLYAGLVLLAWLIAG